MAATVFLVLPLILSILPFSRGQQCSSSILLDGQTNNDTNALGKEKGDGATPHRYTISNDTLIYNATVADQYYYTMSYCDSSASAYTELVFDIQGPVGAIVDVALEEANYGCTAEGVVFTYNTAGLTGEAQKLIMPLTINMGKNSGHRIYVLQHWSLLFWQCNIGN